MHHYRVHTKRTLFLRRYRPTSYPNSNVSLIKDEFYAKEQYLANSTKRAL